MKKKYLLMMSVLGVFFAGQISQAKQVLADSKVKIVTTFYPVYEFTKGVVGGEGNVSMLMKAGTEPHDFEPSTKDIKKIQDADAFVYMDDNMETWVPDMKKSLTSKKVAVIKGTGDMLLVAGAGHSHEHDHDDADKKHDHDHDEEGHSHAFDPHVWLSPYRSITVVETIRDGLSKAYPDKADHFKSNAAAYIEKLKELDKEYSDAFSAAKQKSFVTQHAAFGYMALDYGLNQISINGVTPDTEPSAKRIAELSKYVKKYDINYIYFEENASSKVAKTLAKEAGVKTAVLSPLEGLTEKDMKAGKDYFTVMRENLKTLRLTTDVEGKEILPEEDTTKTVYNGYFKDKQVKDRKLSDWAGNWQSVYPFLQDGTLDQVWDYKAKKSKGKMTAAEYKDYYTTGYQTDVSHIKINGKKNTMTFVRNGEKKTFTYKYAGKKILTYPKGNRGVRFMFEAKEPDAGEFKYVQFSDHAIAPGKAEHFHLYWGGDSQEKLHKELEHWPTYYDADLSGRAVAQEINAH
ncbi:zinc ABC transporter substrate-binding protein AdcA [Streptococcus equi]|uniref:Zinc ABC transporter substrate-binding protein AdcA n=1 Tax=Streptococcus equi subsp. ruminatorum TaxID=254358 RepID=A0A6M1KY34_9STRE|nr:zinc ABC transporter substrate-binding protein AdcA [Streptococcus equi]NGL84175.1 zinc ABC transporter substrate-binding protein AdcA [Streptococcus equi subsp. ruminatorum]